MERKKLLSWFVEKDILYFVFTIIIFFIITDDKMFLAVKRSQRSSWNAFCHG